jgi:hypothetical protein
MSDTDKIEMWQETVDMAVAALEKRTGLKLAGCSKPEITHRVRQWLTAKQKEKSCG